ncbi:unnamed protein product [Zymoseptoria tritici ST99CH_3D7]|uniref:DUF1682 domain protein n=1 Tax=Zymoseptoria tritici (strain ST99CH_3D7) TaxID=1276538 RepID=A0A1X7RPH3_ZYMT9|nr:unnamed protein product [Zymoseptoria tritici ST99CH_3D7]
MGEILKGFQGFLGGAKSSVSSVVSNDDSDFADFATAAAPQAPSHVASSVFTEAATTARPPRAIDMFNSPTMAGRPYTKWYRVWERVTIKDFYQELTIIPIIVFIILVNLWGAAANRSRAKDWAKIHLPLLSAEYAAVGFGKNKKQPSPDDAELYKEQSKNEYITYCTGRQNVACLDVKLTLYKRYNPLFWAAEVILSFFFESFEMPVERLEATAYAFDGKEKQLVPGQDSVNAKDSQYDGFVWAIVHKDKMKQLRDDRYDVSLTSTKDHPKLPAWATVMSESAEVTEALLTPELIKAVTEAGEDMEALIISDQPVNAPLKLNDTVPKKRVSLAMRLTTDSSKTALFSYFLRLPDFLVNSAHFRPEAMRKIRATREEQMKKIRRVDEDEKAEERKLASEKLKKEERDRKLAALTAAEQKKFLEKEKDKEQRKIQKKQTMRG